MWAWTINGVALAPLSYLLPSGRGIFDKSWERRQNKRFLRLHSAVELELQLEKSYPVPGKFVLFILFRICVLPDSEKSCLSTIQKNSHTISLLMWPLLHVLSLFQEFLLDIMYVIPSLSISYFFLCFPDFYLLFTFFYITGNFFRSVFYVTNSLLFYH